MIFFIYIFRSTKTFRRVKWSLTGYVSNTDLRELNVTGSGIGLAQFPSLHPKKKLKWTKWNCWVDDCRETQFHGC